jgi:A/G-specific adenine glycosylase
VTIRRVLKPRHTTSAIRDAKAFRDALDEWFSANKRDYPWRRTHDPYRILVSEVMLQQTQIATVLGKGYYTRFLDRFPDLHALADADDGGLLKAWEGLGYYRRVRMLQGTARAVIERHAGGFPRELDALMSLPGIGRYTAGALRAFAFGLPAVVVDGNISRVLARLMDFKDAVDDAPGRRRIWKWAEALADPERPRSYHAAMMELGQTHCRPGTPDCHACPVARFCRCRRPARLPVKSRRTLITGITEHAVWQRDPAGRVLLHRESGSRRNGMWRLPLRDAAELQHLPEIARHNYPITRYQVTLHVHHGNAGKSIIAPQKHDTWVHPDDCAALPVAAPFKRVITQLMRDF